MTGAITIVLGGPDGNVDASTLVESLQNVISAFRELESPLHAPASLRWEVIKASMQSPLSVSLAPAGDTQEVEQAGLRIAKAFSRGLRDVSSASARPPHFSDEVLDHAKKLVRVTAASRTTLTLYVPDEPPVSPSTQTAANIDVVTAGVRTRYEEGTIEGKLETVSTRQKDSFVIWEVLTQHRIDCVVERPEDLELAKQLLRRRVAVTGEIRYRDRKPVGMRVTHFRPLRLRSELPQLADLPALNIAGGKPSEDFVRELRDGV